MVKCRAQTVLVPVELRTACFPWRLADLTLLSGQMVDLLGSTTRVMTGFWTSGLGTRTYAKDNDALRKTCRVHFPSANVPCRVHSGRGAQPSCTLSVPIGPPRTQAAKKRAWNGPEGLTRGSGSNRAGMSAGYFTRMSCLGAGRGPPSMITISVSISTLHGTVHELARAPDLSPAGIPFGE